MRRAAAIAVLLALLPACRTAYYSVWEKLGKEKRELLADRVEDARDQQKETAEEFKDALQRLQEAYGRSGSDLERTYESIRDQYERSRASADELEDRIDRVERVARDLFDEWEEEIATMESAEFKRRSRQQLERTRTRYRSLSRAMRQAYARVDPVLVRLRDTTTFLKHNLNAQALGMLQKEKEAIERDTQRLLKEMNEAIAEANRFLEGIEDEA